MLIVFEGVDSVGKKTQVEFFERYLRDINRSYFTFDFPRYQTPTGRVINAYLKGAFGPMADLNPYAIADMYTADQAAARHKIKEALGKYDTVLCNRYYLSNIAFQRARFDEEGAKRKITDYIETRSILDSQLPVPDFTIFLFCSQKQQWRDMMEGRGGAADQHESNHPFLDQVEKEYFALLPTLPGQSIDIADLTPEQVSDEVLRSLRPILQL